MAGIRRNKKQHSRFTRVRAFAATVLVIGSISIIGPLTYDEQAYAAFDQASRAWRGWGDQVLGIDLTAPRQNLFSLVRDLDRTVTVVDHSTIYRSHLMGLTNWMSRGALYSVADALRWFNIPLTTAQARMIELCKPLDRIHEDQPIVIQSDPYQQGVASWYGPGFHGRLAASGEIYNMYDMSAAHKTLPLQSVVRVVSQRTGNSIVVRINDRGPYVGGRIIDLSRRAKDALGAGDLAAVYIERLDPTALDGSCE
jgi:hypothetical protein